MDYYDLLLSQKLNGGGGGITPSGTKSITANGTYDVTTYASADVNVSGWSSDDIAMKTISGNINLQTATKIGDYAFYGTSITGINAPYVTSLGTQAFSNTEITELDNSFPLMVPSTSNLSSNGYVFANMKKLKRVYLPNTGCWAAKLDTFRSCGELLVLRLPNQSGDAEQRATTDCKKLKIIDWGNGRIHSNEFSNNNALQIIILRATTALQTLSNTNAFTNTPFLGYNSLSGTIYIPQVFYNHLGDGTSNDYQSATNWSTLYSGGHCTFAKLEGSPYEQIDWDDSSFLN